MLLFYQQQSVRSSYRVILSEIGVRSKRTPMQSKDLVLAGRVNGLSGGVATIAGSSRGDALGKLPSASVLPSSSAGSFDSVAASRNGHSAQEDNAYENTSFAAITVLQWMVTVSSISCA